MEAKSILIQSDQGHDLHAFGEVMSVKLGGAETGGKLAVLTATTPPGVGPPPHVHRDDDELFLVIEGSITYLVNGEWTPVRPGGAVYLPRGLLHTYRNDGDAPSRHWVITTPSGFEEFFAEAAEEFGSAGPPDMGRIIEISQNYGIELMLDPSA